MTSTLLNIPESKLSLEHPVTSFREVTAQKLAQTASAEMIDIATDSSTFKSYEAMLSTLQTHPEQLNLLTECIDISAEDLIVQIDAMRANNKKYHSTLNDTWTAVQMWDKVRSKSTRRLAGHLIQHFPGDGQASLSWAFNDAIEQGIPFEMALDEHNKTRLKD